MHRLLRKPDCRLRHRCREAQDIGRVMKPHMKRASFWYNRLLSLTLLLIIGAPGCSWQHSAQRTLPAASSRDEVQFFPAGPEGKLLNQRRALEEYEAALAAAEAAQTDSETSAEDPAECGCDCR